MVQSKSILGLLILSIVLMSGCLNSNESIKKTQPIITPTPIQTPEVLSTPTPIKIINLEPSQLILIDVEVNAVLGSDWKKTAENPPNNIDSSNYHAKGFKSFYANVGSLANIEILVHPDIYQTYTGYAGEISNHIRRNDKGNDIDIGDTFAFGNSTSLIWEGRGKIYSWDTGEQGKYRNVEVTFIKNNVLIKIVTTNIGIEQTIELAKKQEAKISSILDMIK